MNNLINLILVAATVAYVYAAVAIFPKETKPPAFADQEGCYLSKFNAVLPYEEPYYPNDDKSCEEYTCQTNNETQLVTCGAYGFPPNCRLVKDLTLDYPKCCGDVVCDPTTVAPTTSDEFTTGVTTSSPNDYGTTEDTTSGDW